MKGFKINFHCHSNFSDGGDMEKAVQEYKRLGFCCAVFTDHIYPNNIDTHWTNTKDGFLSQISLAKELEKKYNIPIILGAEVNLSFEEVVIFNHVTIFEIFKIIENSGKNKANRKVRELLPDLLSANKDFSILVHPCLDFSNEDKYPFKVLEKVKCYEKYNQARNFFKSREIPEILRGKIELSNSDAHSHSIIASGYNFVDVEIRTFEDLIKIKDNNIVELFKMNDNDLISLYQS